MTYCDTLSKPLLEKIESGKTLKEIGKSFCGDSVLNPRAKAIRLIKSLLGDHILKQHSETLGYDYTHAVRIKKHTTSTEQKNNKNVVNIDDFVLESLKRLIRKYGKDVFLIALKRLEDEKYQQKG